MPAPMGRRAVKKTPELESEPEKPQTPKKTQTPQRKQKRQVQKKKRNASTTTPRSNVDSENNTPSPPALSITTSFSSPGGQLPLPDGFNLTQTYGLRNNNNNMTAMNSNVDNKMAMAILGGDFSNTFDGVDFDDVFANDYNDGHSVGMDFGQLTIDPTQVMFDNTMSGLDEANNIRPTTESFTSSDTTNIENEIFGQISDQSNAYSNNENVTNYTGYQFGVIEPTGTESQLYGTDGTVEPTSPTGGRATGLSSALGDVILDRIAKGELSEVQALSVLHKLTKKLEGGEH